MTEQEMLEILDVYNETVTQLETELDGIDQTLEQLKSGAYDGTVSKKLLLYKIRLLKERMTVIKQEFHALYQNYIKEHSQTGVYKVISGTKDKPESTE